MSESLKQALERIASELGRELNGREELVTAAVVAATERDKLLKACERVLDWALTPASDPGGSFSVFAEEIVPMLAATIAEVTGGVIVGAAVSEGVSDERKRSVFEKVKCA
ncbi:MAG: hypothetical protein H6662_15450 [Ardenticatenaceae bacterium]|nr:hypothetical protein [Anaerolineales bacterium]MCB8922982.1 hypothetical protein [Ardenticatenaceae bacterium]MCB8990285.1 hypothetical protein [Ardenticatenaceae bacterium]